MRKLIVTNIISVDGYYSGPGDNVMALPFDPAFDDYNAERLRAAGTLLLGRKSFDGFKDYWPPVADDPNVREVEREISRLNGAIPKVVISDTLTQDRTAPWTDTTIVPRADAHEYVAAMKREQGKDILVFGSHTMWNDLLAAGLVDELHLMVGPSLLGAGIPLFEGHPEVPLRLLDARVLDESQLVLTRYAPR
jgi:dihydrofolate reductase